MVRTERRQVPRMKVKELAYVNLEPNNGGIILDISEGGLCFQSPAPVQRTETIRLWFSYRSHRIEVDEGIGGKDGMQARGVSRYIEVGSKLAWIDQTRKKGGIRFTNLPAEAREQIRDWIGQSGPVIIKPSSGESPFSNLRQSVTNAARSSSARLVVLVRDLRLARLRTGFSSGLVVGVLFSVLLLVGFLLLSHTRELGNSLIQFGEGLGGRSRSRSTSPPLQGSSQGPQATASEPQPPSPELEPIRAVPPTVAPSSGQIPRQEKISPPAPRAAANQYGANLQGASPAVDSLPVPRVTASDIPSRPSTPGIGTIAPASDSTAGLVRTTTPEMELATRPGVHLEPSKVEESKAEGIGIHSDKYLEVGKFKEKLQADKANRQLSQLGFPAAVTQRNNWRGKSYQVLVGPYGSNVEAEAAHRDLASLGYPTRPLERGTRDFQLPSALKVGGTHLPAGDCVISWESYIPDAVVKTEDDRGTSVIVEGKWVKQAVPYNKNAIEYQKNLDGSRSLIEIRFSGMRQALVFGTGSS
jgi:hypothetical protein